LKKEQKMKCPLEIGTIVKMKTHPYAYWNNKRDREVYTVIGIERDPEAEGNWMIRALSETGRTNPWMSIGWYKKA